MPVEPKNYRFDPEKGKYRDSESMRAMGKVRGEVQPYSKGQAQPYGTGKYFQPGGVPAGFGESLEAARGAVAEDPAQQLYQQRLGGIYGQLEGMEQRRGGGGGGAGGMPTISTPEYGEKFTGFGGVLTDFMTGKLKEKPFETAGVAEENVMRGAQQYTDMEIDKQAQAGGYFGTARHQQEKNRARHQTEQNIEVMRQQMTEKGAQYGLNVGQVATQFYSQYKDAKLGMQELKQRADFKRADIQVQYRQLANASARAGIGDAFRMLSMKLDVAGKSFGAATMGEQNMLDNYWKATASETQRFQFGTEMTEAEIQSDENRQLKMDLAKMEGKSRQKSSIFGILGKIVGSAIPIVGSLLKPGGG